MQTKKKKTNKLWHISTPGPVIEKKIANFQIFIYLFVLENKEKLSTSPFFLGVPNFAQMWKMKILIT